MKYEVTKSDVEKGWREREREKKKEETQSVGKGGWELTGLLPIVHNS